MKEQKADYLQWDVKSFTKALDYWDKNINWKNINNALELGGKQGGLSLWLAKKGIDTVCSDYRNTRQTAEILHKKHNLTDRITYQDIDATNIPYKSSFDLIVFKSVLPSVGAFNNLEFQIKLVDECYKALRPGGKLLFAENLVASSFHQVLRKRFVKWGADCRYITIDEMTMFLKKYSSFQLNSNGVLGTLGRNEAQRTFLATIDDAILNKICPEHWKYIVYGIAEK